MPFVPAWFNRIRRSLGVCAAAATLAWLNLAPPVQAGETEPMVFIHHAKESAGDTRYEYHWRVLRAALDATTAQWGPYELREAPYMNETRQVAELSNATGLLNTMVLDTTVELEQKLLPVRLPIDKGLLGYRVFLIRKDDQAAFSQVRTLQQLRAFSIGQGADWSDTQILRQAGFKVVTGYAYEGLFGMLNYRRFDAFSRGAVEVLGEMRSFGPQYPDMQIEESLLLYYPMPVYFWFSRDSAGQQRARRVEQGMRAIQANGTLDRLFKTEFSAVEATLRLKERRVLRIGNPLLPAASRTIDKRWLYDPTR
ncbi:hypothetical protein RQP54_17030 [Curvibacter sp. APW13]|uniref:hypothetical protein n=1 Tax=Curvibacter sp. APW13 TaxID=3077236 RepID=UPI0028DE8B74|nr:hypothetical protein [Curvibacter sp. APW13]MDT8992578.1 hypothetical protein [Curvibacter sp. APW13]